MPFTRSSASASAFGLRRRGAAFAAGSSAFGFAAARALRAADGLDLDLRERGAEAGVAAVAGALLVLPDADLRALHGAEDLRLHHGARVEIRLTVSAHEQDGGRERRAVVLVQPVHEQPLALADAVLLPGNLDDRVRHVVIEIVRPKSLGPDGLSAPAWLLG